MKIISPNVELIRQEPGLEGIFKQIEKAGRTCYKSEDKMDKHTNKVFIHNLIKLGHTSMLEHGTVYLTLTNDIKHCNKLVHFPWYYDNAPSKWDEVFSYVQCLFLGNKYSVVKLHQNEDYTETTMCITTNYRVIIENGWQEIMHEFLSEPTIYHERRITLKFTTNIGVTREGNRMRANSIAEESTRYCDYTKEKHGNGNLNIVPPVWLLDGDKERLNNLTEIEWLQIIFQISESSYDGLGELKYNIDYYGAALVFCNICYNKLRERGWTPQQAREVLPLATKSEVIYTATATQWRHFFDLRLLGTTGKPHPNMLFIAEKAQKVLIENNLWDLIYNPDEKDNN